MDSPSAVPSSPQKRHLSLSAGDIHPSKRFKQSYHRHHFLENRPQVLPPGEPAILEQEALDKLLVEGIKAICEEHSAQLGLDDCVIESLALESFRNATEEFILKLCATVRRSMLAARRTAPIPCDFETAMNVLGLPQADDQLLPYRSKPIINPSLLPTPPPEDAFHNNFQLPASFLGPGLSNETGRKRHSFIPSTLPPLPSKHTYKDTPVYPARETDPRRIRELATEEGKLGEDALRKLAGAVKIEATFNVEPAEEQVEVRRPKARRKQVVSVESAFEDTMRDMLKAQAGSGDDNFELGPIVNAEKRLWKQDEAPARRPPQMERSGTTDAGSSAASIVSGRGPGKQRASAEVIEP